MSATARVGDKLFHGGVPVGQLVEGSADVKVNGRPACRVGDRGTCKKHGLQPIVSGSSTVNANGRALARHGDRLACGAVIGEGSDDVGAGG